MLAAGAALLAGGCAHAVWANDPSVEAAKVCAGMDARGAIARDEPQEIDEGPDEDSETPAPPLPLARIQGLYCLGLYAPLLSQLTDLAIPKPPLTAALLPPTEPKPLTADRLPVLRWIVYIHRRFPGWDRITGVVGKVARADLERAELADVRDDLYLLAGRFEYQQGRFDKALELLRRIPSSSALHVQAAVLEGAVHVRAAAPSLAVTAFGEALRATSASRDPKRVRERDLAVVSLARLYYGLGQHETAGRYYDALGSSSSYWMAAALEGGWTSYQTKDHPRARARVRMLQARSAEVPPEIMAEATMLEATLALHDGNRDEVNRILERFNGVYPQMYMDARKLLLVHPDVLYAIAFSVRAGGALPPPFGSATTKLLLADVPVARRFEELDELAREETRYQALDAKWRESPQGKAVGDELGSRGWAAAHEAGEQFKRRLERLAEGLRAQITQSVRVEYELIPRFVPWGDERL